MTTPLEAVFAALVVILGLTVLGALTYAILSVRYTAWRRYGQALHDATLAMFHAEQANNQHKLGDAKAALKILVDNKP